MKQFLKMLYNGAPYKPQVYSALRKLPMPEKVFKHLHFKGPFSIPIDKSHYFNYYHYGDSVNNELFWRGLSTYEQTSTDLWRRLAAKAHVIVDGGAHTGLY